MMPFGLDTKSLIIGLVIGRDRAADRPDQARRPQSLTR